MLINLVGQKGYELLKELSKFPKRETPGKNGRIRYGRVIKEGERSLVEKLRLSGDVFNDGFAIDEQGNFKSTICITEDGEFRYKYDRNEELLNSKNPLRKIEGFLRKVGLEGIYWAFKKSSNHKNTYKSYFSY